jgi:hypothetical protein
VHLPGLEGLDEARAVGLRFWTQHIAGEKGEPRQQVRRAAFQFAVES